MSFDLVSPLGWTWTLLPHEECVAGTPWTLWSAGTHEEATRQQLAQLDLARPDQREAFAKSAMFVVLWPVARALAGTVAGMDVRGLRVLEVGCGLALPSLVAARGGARVLATDHHPDVLALVGRNAATNGVRLDVGVLDWTSDRPAGRFDLVLASDVLFAADCAQTLPAFLLDVLEPGGRALVADPCRPWHDAFEARCREVGLTVVTELVDDALISTLTLADPAVVPTIPFDGQHVLARE
ncbi:MAG: methyltransferase domain-containing protein [Myxococcales bacterium]|nr:methyltransferase domain-containing protein [Myxococcales bacterium]